MQSVCDSCKQPKAMLACGVCQALLCKKCIQRVDENLFLYMETVPVVLTHRNFCAPCFNTHYYPAELQYAQDVRRAKGLFVFYKAKSEQTRLLNRSEKPLKTIECPDRDEALMRLAYQASRAGFNGIIDVIVSSKKIRNFGYQTASFNATGVPTMVDAERLERENTPAGSGP